MKRILFALCVVCFVFTATAFAGEFQADVVSVVMGKTTSSKIFYKDADTSRTEVMGMIIITKGDISYQLFKDTKKYVVMDMDEAEEQNPMADADDFEEFIKENDMKKIGSESVAGYKCDVYEGSVTYEENQPATAMKMWYAPKLDYPVKTETQLPAPMSGMAVSTLENIKTGKQPGSLFEIPAGYTQAQNMAEAMGMGGSLGSGQGETEGMPSEGDLNKMMNMMKEMMGGQGQN